MKKLKFFLMFCLNYRHIKQHSWAPDPRVTGTGNSDDQQRMFPLPWCLNVIEKDAKLRG